LSFFSGLLAFLFFFAATLAAFLFFFAAFLPFFAATLAVFLPFSSLTFNNSLFALPIYFFFFSRLFLRSGIKMCSILRSIMLSISI
jgi:hypothetical protein